MKIEKGKQYRCIVDYIMNDKRIAYRQGTIYYSPDDDVLTSEIDVSHKMPFDLEHCNYFELASTPTHYDNSNGSIYKFCEDQKLNAWEFDIIKRVVRSRKKGLFKEDLEKTKVLIDLYLKEYSND